MKRPYYIHTPRNRYGESLVGPSIHNPPYEIRATHAGQTSHGTGKNLEALKQRAIALNYEHEIMLAYAMHI